MKKIFLLGGLFLLVFAACSKKDDAPEFDVVAQYDADSAKIVAYLTANNITDVQHEPRGIFYQIVNRGDNQDSVNGQANVTVAYDGTLLDKSRFDSSHLISFDLPGVITGWRIGIPKIGKGGEINLFLPSYYAYQQYGKDQIPPNTILVFNVKLFDFINK
jgi:FKBP-type peptidyl-prolyl cis-trans isomerase